MKFRDLLARAATQRRIQIGERLIEHENFRVFHDRPADGHALPLAAGQFCGHAIQQRLHFQHPRHFADPPIDLLRVHADVAQPERKVLAHGHVRIQRVALKDHCDAAFAGGQMIDTLAVDLDRARVDGFQPGYGAQQCRFSASGRSQHDQKLVRADLDRNIVEHHRAPEALADTFERKTAHAAAPP